MLNKLKKLSSIMLSSILMLSLVMFTGCGSDTKNEYKLITDRVIEVTYDSYDMTKAASGLDEYYDKFDVGQGAGGCSALKTMIGDKIYVGRNYDFYCSESPAFVVHNNFGKYKTIGIGNSHQTLGAWKDNYEINDRAYGLLPFLCCDVMSEAGVYAETNIRYSEEGLECATTRNQAKEGAVRTCTQTMLLRMLSAYGSVDEILSHMNDYDWYDLTEIGFCQSVFLVDTTGKSVCVEFADNSWTATEVDYNANFFINPTYYNKEKWPLGELRIQKEVAYRDSHTMASEADVFAMMSVGTYARFYKSDCDVDYAIGEWMKDLNPDNPYTRFNIEDNRDEARIKMQRMLNAYNGYSWKQLCDNQCWETVFCVAANVTDKTLNVQFSEHFKINFTVSF